MLCAHANSEHIHQLCTCTLHVHTPPVHVHPPWTYTNPAPARSVNTQFTEHAWSLHWVWTELVRSMHKWCTKRAPAQLVYVHRAWMCIECSCTERARSVIGACTERNRSVHGAYSYHALSVHWMCTKCALSVPWECMECARFDSKLVMTIIKY